MLELQLNEREMTALRKDEVCQELKLANQELQNKNKAKSK